MGSVDQEREQILVKWMNLYHVIKLMKNKDEYVREVKIGKERTNDEGVDHQAKLIWNGTTENKDSSNISLQAYILE